MLLPLGTHRRIESIVSRSQRRATISSRLLSLFYTFRRAARATLARVPEAFLVCVREFEPVTSGS